MVLCKGQSEEVKDEQNYLSLEGLQVGSKLGWILDMRVWSALKKPRNNIVFGSLIMACGYCRSLKLIPARIYRGP